jgi:hypothetical protein
MEFFKATDFPISEILKIKCRASLTECEIISAIKFPSPAMLSPAYRGGGV